MLALLKESVSSRQAYFSGKLCSHMADEPVSQCLLKSCFEHCWFSDYWFTEHWDLRDYELPWGGDWCAHPREPVVVR